MEMIRIPFLGGEEANWHFDHEKYLIEDKGFVLGLKSFDFSHLIKGVRYQHQLDGYQGRSRM